MQIHELQRSKTQKKPHARVGRGGKRGTTAGRGTKGQRARSGHRIRPAERDFIQRSPKLRGFSNPSLKDKPYILHLGEVAKKMPGTNINIETLRDAKLIPHSETRVKILSDGKITRALIIHGIPVSESAKKNIIDAGGTVHAT